MEGGIVNTISSQACELPEYQGKLSIGLITSVLPFIVLWRFVVH
jgi:hypothetical protein